jgi:4'-phosphopantetheinyl transferase
MDIVDSESSVKSPLDLAGDAVHLWRVDLDAVSGVESRWSSVLSEDERIRAARFHFEKDRQHFIAGRAFLRRVIAAYLKTDPIELIFEYSEKSKPSLGGDYRASRLDFNISHSGGIALFAFTRGRRIGVDVEQVRHDFDTSAIAARFFSACEREQLAALPLEGQHEAFFRCWTRKESYIKATGEGLSLPLSQFDVSIAADDRNALLATRPDELEARQWSLRDVHVRPGYCGAVCVSGTGWELIDSSSAS